jgi:hypothetical protein
VSLLLEVVGLFPSTILVLPLLIEARSLQKGHSQKLVLRLAKFKLIFGF